MKLLRMFLAMFLLFASTLHAQTSGKFAAIAPRMQEFVNKGEIAGIVTLVADKDHILHLGAVGKTDLATDRKMKTDDIFWIASMSKPITSVCVAMLVDDGKLNFDDPVEKYLPEFAASAPTTRPSQPIKVRDLLTHTSGLGEVNNRQPHLTLAQTAELVAKSPRRFLPGERWAYSTAGIDTLGRIVEVASGMPFDQFMQKRLLDPLGMKDTSFWIPADSQSRYAHPYRWNAQTSKLDDERISYLYNTEVTDRQRPPLGGAGLFSTAEDIARFYQMMLNKGELNGHRILKSETVAEMTRNQIGKLTARPGMPWGYGFCVIEDPNGMEANKIYAPNSFGHGGAFSTQSWADSTKGLIYILMMERNGRGNPDNSDIRIAFQQEAVTAMAK